MIDIFESSEESDLTCVRVNRYCADSMKPTGNCKMYQIYEGHYFAGIPYPAVRVRDTIPGMITGAVTHNSALLIERLWVLCWSS